MVRGADELDCGAGERMRRRRSYGFVSKDWKFFIGLQLAILAMLVVSGVLLPVLAGARQGGLMGLWIALAAALAGVVLLFVAKWPLYCQGRYFTFGSKALVQERRWLYRLAYVFVIGGVLLMLMLWAVVR